MLDHKDQLFISPGARAMSGFKLRFRNLQTENGPYPFQTSQESNLQLADVLTWSLLLMTLLWWSRHLFLLTPQNTKSLRLKENQRNMKGREANKYEGTAYKISSVDYVNDERDSTNIHSFIHWVNEYFSHSSFIHITLPSITCKIWRKVGSQRLPSFSQESRLCKIHLSFFTPYNDSLGIVAL